MSKGLTKQQKSQAKDKMKEMAMQDNSVSPEEMKKLEEMMKIAKMPIELKDSDIQMGEGEVDVRKLSEESYKQLIFRLFTLNNVYVRDLCTSLIDVMRLMMILLEKLGIDDVPTAMDQLMDKLSKQMKSKQMKSKQKLN